ncbi:hypothetical protein PoMZ_01722 [Pyricularia oryzae]|uniref:Uncharacterized protein n=1 Tax=Pyricularia oryzae TaxID=318829 RepID=A0A4P7N7A2_PYROR|nr:hypothetical protein PoMZ_01722 [Pyricularia oryzae]
MDFQTIRIASLQVKNARLAEEMKKYKPVPRYLQGLERGREKKAGFGGYGTAKTPNSGLQRRFSGFIFCSGSQEQQHN